MSSKRPPFWFTASQFNELNTLIVQQLDQGDRAVAGTIHEELAVAKARFKNGIFKSNLLATVLGMDRESVPVRLSEQEHAYLLTLPLSNNLRKGLDT